MSTSPELPKIKEFSRVSSEEFAEIRQSGQPTVLRALAKDWPVVAASRESDEALVAYLGNLSNGRPVSAIMASPDQHQRFFYNEDISGFNFVRGKGDFKTFLSDLLKLREASSPPSMAVQSAVTDDIMPSFSSENTVGFLQDKQPRIWIGNRARVAPHYDVQENVAICAAGKRRFTLFPPDQIANLYPGPLELTPAGTPVSMVDIDNPDFKAHPRFAEAQKQLQQVELEPGDAIYIPYCWWHAVESLDSVSCLVNYWWDEAQPGLSGPYDALLHCLGTFRHLPEHQRAIWKDWLDYYVFEREGDPAAHLPDSAKGILSQPSPALFAKMRGILRNIF